MAVIFVDIDDIRREWRNAFAKEPAISITADLPQQLTELGEANNCKIRGKNLFGGAQFVIEGIEFPDEASLLWFKLKWL